MAYESFAEVNPVRGKIAAYIESLDASSRANLEAAFANPGVSAPAIRRALLAEGGFSVASSTIVAYRAEAAAKGGEAPVGSGPTASHHCAM